MLSTDLLLTPAARRTLIAGQWRTALSDRDFAVRNPANGEVLSTVPDCAEKETELAIEAAAAALPPWRRMTSHERAAKLMAWFGLLREQRDALARLLTLEQGKPLRESLAELDYGASFVQWFAEEGKRAYGEIIPSPRPDRRLFVTSAPVGVCAAITPWNFPLAMVTRKLAPALAAGCTMVLKPAEATPLTALALAALAERAGMPAGVVNVVTAGRSNAAAVGSVLCESPVVRHLSFTGSTAVGRVLMRQCSSTVKKLALELGGNAPFIVFDDADLGAAVEGALASKFRNAGQTCVCTNRFYVQSGVHDRFTQALADRVSRLRLGNGLDDGVDIGPLINADAVAKAMSHIHDALARGATVLGDLHRPAGNFMRPAVLTGVDPSSRLCVEETFGPVAGIVRFDTEEQALDLANASEFGLAGYVYTRDVARAMRVSEALEVGMVGLNTGLISNEVAPFGGIKQSGLGREGSRHGLAEYLELKYVCAAAT